MPHEMREELHTVDRGTAEGMVEISGDIIIVIPNPPSYERMPIGILAVMAPD